jgi:hypothetical protein
MTIKKEPPMNDWISVKDRPEPPKDGRYILTRVMFGSYAYAPTSLRWGIAYKFLTMETK